MLSAGKLVTCSHLQGQLGADLDFGGQQLGTIPVMVNLLHNLLLKSELLAFLLLLCESLLFCLVGIGFLAGKLIQSLIF